MIIGDHPKTAAVIAQDRGISPEGPAVTGAALKKMPDGLLDKMVQEVSVYVRVTPEHILEIESGSSHMLNRPCSGQKCGGVGWVQKMEGTETLHERRGSAVIRTWTRPILKREVPERIVIRHSSFAIRDVVSVSTGCGKAAEPLPEGRTHILNDGFRKYRSCLCSDSLWERNR